MLHFKFYVRISIFRFPFTHFAYAFSTFFWLFVQLLYLESVLSHSKWGRGKTKLGPPWQGIVILPGRNYSFIYLMSSSELSIPYGYSVNLNFGTARQVYGKLNFPLLKWVSGTPLLWLINGIWNIVGLGSWRIKNSNWINDDWLGVLSLCGEVNCNSSIKVSSCSNELQFTYV